MSELSRRAGRNQVLFREINERIREIGDADGVPVAEPWDFLCECAAQSCKEIVSITVGEYEAIRRSPTRFPVRAGHEVSGVEVVVERKERYVVVEKFDEAADIARANDPRENGGPGG
jgi:hypothetical protein